MTTAQRKLIAVFVLLTFLNVPVLKADSTLLDGADEAWRPAGATAGTQAEAESSSRSCLTVIISWAPILLLAVLWLFFMRHYGKVLRRNRQHMDELERLTKEIVAALGRIEQALDRK